MIWCCFRTHNKKERVAVSNIRKELNAEAFSPLISQIKRTSAGSKRFTEAIFPCYGFARIDTGEQLMELKCLRGVSKVLQLGSQIAHVPEAVIEQLRSRLNHEDILWLEHAAAKVDQLARIDTGPFRDFVGRIVRSSNNGERVCVLLDILGRQVSTRINLDRVSPQQFAEPAAC